jgi:aspartyl/asparaginyl-tRNA synthetase
LLKILFSTSLNTLDKCQDDLKFLETRLLDEEKSKPQAERSEMPLLEKLNFVLENNFKRVSYTEAIDILRDCTPNKRKSSTISLTNGVPTYNQSTNVI